MTQEHIKDETSAGNPKNSGDQSSPSPEEYQTAPSTVTEYFTVSSSNLNINDDPVKDAKLPTKVYTFYFFILRPQYYRMIRTIWHKTLHLLISILDYS